MKLKKPVSMLLALLMVISCIPLSASSFSEVWDGTADTDWAGEGTEEEPYQISTAQELAGFSQQINSGNNTYAHYILTNDITLNALTDLESWGTYDDNDEIIAPANSWTPIGDLSGHLLGSFDGDGHTVRGIYINSGHDYHGLFGYSEGTIKNLGVADSYIYGDERVGGIVANSYGELINCYSSATVKGNFYVGGLAAHANKATNCYNTGTVSGSDYVGGVAGIGNHLTNCYSTGTVSGNSYCGGVVGNCNGETVSSYYLSGTATVGINGPSGCGTVDSLTQEEMKLRESYEGWNFNNVWELGYIDGYAFPTLRICGSRDMKYYVKFVSEGETVSEELLASNAEITTPVPDENDTYDFAYWKNGSMKYAPGETVKVTQDAVFTAVWAVPNTSENVWDGTADIEWDGTGTQDDPYQIATAEQLAGLSRQTAEGNTYFEEYFILTSDILLNDGGESFTPYICGKTPWTPIDNFHGSFDGKGHTVSGMYIDSDKDYQGLFGNCFGTLKNLGTINSFVQGDMYVGGVVSFCFEEVTGCYNTGTVIGYNSVGGVVGSCDTVEKCYNTGDISGMDSVGGVVGMGNAENCHNSGKVNARKFVGGVVGMSVDTVSSCYNTGDISGVEKVGGVLGYGNVDNSYNTGAVSGDFHVGGNVGVGNTEICYNMGEVNGDTSAGGNVGYGEAETCYNTGTVSGGSQIGGVAGYGGAQNCYNTGTVNSTEFYAGGVVGFNSEETANCYNTGKVNGSTYVGGVTGFGGGSMTACYYLDSCMAVSENYGTALSSEQMKNASCFVGFDFTDKWEFGAVDDGYLYPTLKDAVHVFICYVTFLDYDGVTVLSTVPVIKGEGAVAPDMSKKSFKDSDYTYEFEKWDIPFSEVTEDLVVKAVYKKTKNKNAGELFALNKVDALKASSNTSSSVKLTWTAVEGATGYQLFKYNGRSYVYYKYLRTNSFTDTALKANSTVYYKVRAYMNYSGRNYFTALSSFVKTYTAPARVSGLKVSVYANTALRLTWTRVSGATAYRVYMYNPKTRAYVGYKNTTSNILTVSSLKAGTQYYFKVRAYRTIGGVNYWGDYSNFIKTSTRPLNTAITSVSSPARGRLTVKWRASAGAAGYLVQYSTSRNFSGAVTRYVRGTSYTATGLTSGRIYYVRVRPYVLMGTSKIYSPSVSSYRYIKTR